jgi:lysozyme family protein
MAMAFTRREDVEGGWYPGTGAHDPNPTMEGVTQRTYDAWRKRKRLPKRLVRLIEDHEWKAIAFEGYWIPARCDLLPPLVAVAHFDCAFNMGPQGAIKVAQHAAGVEDDGIVGPLTLAAWNTTGSALLNPLLWSRLHRYHEIVVGNRSKRAALPHWLYRTIQLRAYCARLATAYPEVV